MSAGGVNKAILMGHVSRGPQIRTTKAGVPQAVFGLETSEIWFDKETNEKREKTIGHRIVVYGPLVKVVGKYLRKGARVFVEGMIETRRWVKHGQPETWTTEIVVQGWSGQLTILDYVNDKPTTQTDAPTEDDLGAASTSPDQDNKIDAGRFSWLAQQEGTQP